MYEVQGTERCPGQNLAGPHSLCRPDLRGTDHTLQNPIFSRLTTVQGRTTELPFLLRLCTSFAHSAASCCFCFSNCLMSLASFLCFLDSFTVYEEESMIPVGKLDASRKSGDIQINGLRRWFRDFLAHHPVKIRLYLFVIS